MKAVDNALLLVALVVLQAWCVLCMSAGLWLVQWLPAPVEIVAALGGLCVAMVVARNMWSRLTHDT